MEIPLFPLRTVLYPGGPLPLRIFEQRYIDMISRCMKTESPFGVLLIRKGNETGPSDTYDIGTLARITDWYQGSDGLLGITATGGERFRLLSSRRQTDGLAIGDVELLAEEAACALPESFAPLAKILAGVLDDLGSLYESLDKHYDDAGWVGYRFSEILPLSPEQKQTCLETANPITRLKMLHEVLDSVRN
jgi:Lon protease-like protein